MYYTLHNLMFNALIICITYLMTGATNNGWEDSPRGVITGKTSFAHAGAIVNNESSNVFVTHLGRIVSTVWETRDECLVQDPGFQPLYIAAEWAKSQVYHAQIPIRSESRKKRKQFSIKVRVRSTQIYNTLLGHRLTLRHTHHLCSTFQNEKQKLSFLPRKIFHLQLLATKQSSKIKSNLNFNEKLAKVWKNFNFGYFGLH